MLTKEQVKKKHKEIIKKLIPLERKSGLEPNLGPLLSNHILTKGMTCDTCQDNDTCEFAFDAYNTDGDCIAIK